MNEFFPLGAYAGYLATAWGVTAVVVVGNIVAARRRFRRVQNRLREQLDRRSARSEGKTSG